MGSIKTPATDNRWRNLLNDPAIIQLLALFGAGILLDSYLGLRTCPKCGAKIPMESLSKGKRCRKGSHKQKQPDCHDLTP